MLTRSPILYIVDRYKLKNSIVFSINFIKDDLALAGPKGPYGPYKPIELSMLLLLAGI
jgi:hypothetical protein